MAIGRLGHLSLCLARPQWVCLCLPVRAGEQWGEHFPGGSWQLNPWKHQGLSGGSKGDCRSHPSSSSEGCRVCGGSCTQGPWPHTAPLGVMTPACRALASLFSDGAFNAYVKGQVS